MDDASFYVLFLLSPSLPFQTQKGTANSGRGGQGRGDVEFLSTALEVLRCHESGVSPWTGWGGDPAPLQHHSYEQPTPDPPYRPWSSL